MHSDSRSIAELLVASVVPSTVSVGGGSDAPPPLPLPELLPVALDDQGLTHAIARLDDSGRVCDTTIAAAAGWQPGDRLTLHTHTNHIIAARDPNGLHTRTTRRTLSLPAALRYRCGIHPGDQLLLTAIPTHHLVLIHPVHTLNTMLLHHHTTPTERDHHDHP